MTASAPDYSEPIVGFRAWHADRGDLVPWSAHRSGPWTPGVNQARCLFEGAHPRQVPPVADCSCGLYALADPDDPRLRPAHEAVGAVVAWGDVEVHATGFRSQYAAIVALALPDRCDADHGADLRKAAARYGVPLVPVGHLAAAAEYGRPIAFEAIPVRRRPAQIVHRDPVPPLTGAPSVTGIAIDEHLEVTITGGGIRLAPTPPLAEALAGRELRWAPPGTGLAAGDELARGEDLLLRTPVAGVAGRDGWLAPARWEEEGNAIAWGAAGRRFYAAHVADLRGRADPFASLRASWIHAHARIRSAVDVLEALREQRARPRFASLRELRALLGEALEIAAEDPAVATALARLPARMVWRVHEPGAVVVLDRERPAVEAPTAVLAPDGPAAEAPGARRRSAEAVVLHASAEAADDWLAGRLDLAAALRRGEVRSSAPRTAVLRAASVLKPLHAHYAEASSRASSFAS